MPYLPDKMPSSITVKTGQAYPQDRDNEAIIWKMNPLVVPQPVSNSHLSSYILICYTAVFSVATQRSSPRVGGALRDDTKNGRVADCLHTCNE